MEIRRITGYLDQWDGFVESSINGTVFHKLSFLSYHPDGRFDFYHMLISQGEDILALIPGAKILRGSEVIFKSPAGASFGGLVIRDGVHLDKICEAIGILVANLRDEGFGMVDLQMPPICYWKRCDRSVDFALLQCGFSHIGSEATAVIDLNEFDMEKLDSTLIRNLRKARSSGIRVKQSRDFEAFYNLLSDCLESKGAVPTHTLEELVKLGELLGEKMVLFEAVLDSKQVAGVLVFKCNPMCSLAFYICDDAEFRSMRVVEHLLCEVALILKEQGYRYFDLGTVSIDGKVNFGLLRFKYKFGARIYTRDRYTLHIGGKK